MTGFFFMLIKERFNFLVEIGRLRLRQIKNSLGNFPLSVSNG
jgi:hypothetical protein